jgi:hypothetical protein
MHANETSIAQALLSAPGWARVGLTAPAEGLREDAALELARAVLEERRGLEVSPDQLKLGL